MPLNEHDAANFLSVQLIEFERRSAARIRTRISCECVSATYEDLTSGVIGMDRLTICNECQSFSGVYTFMHGYSKVIYIL